MKVKIKYIQSEDYEDNVIRENWIYVKLKSGREIDIFDDVPFKIYDYEGKNVNFFVESGLYSIASSMQSKNVEGFNKTFEGIYLKNFKLPSDCKKANWFENGSYEFYRKNLQAFITDVGIIHLGGGINKIMKKGIIEGKNIILNFARLDLTAWYPIDD